MRFRVDIRRKHGLSDPEGVTTRRALADLGYQNVDDVQFGRSIYVDVDGKDTDDAASQVDEMCRRLLANPVMEDYTVTAVDDVGVTA